MPRYKGPTIIGIGAQKCASTWVHSALGAHPQIEVSTPKEIDFFSYYFDRGYNWYESHFSAASKQPVRFEASPSYFHDPRAPQRVFEYNPSMKILLMLRDPIERAYSNHLHEIIKGHIGNTSFASGLLNNPSYVEQGLYATHLSRWLSVFPRDQILVLFAENLKPNPERTARQVYSFAGVDSNFTSRVLSERRNESDRAKSSAFRTVTRCGGALLRKLGKEENLAKLKSISVVSRALTANSRNMRNEVESIDAETMAKLNSIFKPEMKELLEILEMESLPWKVE